jgi:hypothetical protein
MDASIFCGPGRTFPIEDQGDVDSAAHLIGKAKNSSAVIACIKGKASAHGWSIPDAWKGTMSVEATPLSGHSVSAATFSMGDWAPVGDVTFAAQDEPMIRRRGKVFAAGDYPDKNFFAQPEHLLMAALDFDPVPNRIQHISTARQPTYFDGHLGTLDKLEFGDDGETLYGEVTIPAWFDLFMRTKHPDKPLSVSLEFDRETKRVIGNTFVPNPRVADAEMKAAFAAPRGVQAVHDMTVAHGAQCAPPTDGAGASGNMALNHDEFIQKVHDVAAAHGAQCIPVAPPANMARVSFMDALRAMLGMEGNDGIPATGGARTVPPVRAEEQRPMTTPQTATAEFAALETRLKNAEAETERLRKRDEDNQRERRAEKAAAFSDRVIAAKKALPNASERLKALYVQAALDDSAGVATFDDGKAGSRVTELEALFEEMPVHFMTQELLKDHPDLIEMANRLKTDANSKNKKPDQTRIDDLMAHTPTGRTILQERNGK